MTTAPKYVSPWTVVKGPAGASGSFPLSSSVGKWRTGCYPPLKRPRARVLQCASDTEGMGVIPANTQLQTALAVRAAGQGRKAHVELSISTPNGSVSAAGLLLRPWTSYDGPAVCLLQKPSSGRC